MSNKTIHLLCKLTNVHNLLYTYVNVMQHIYVSSCGIFTMAYATYITFGINIENFQSTCSITNVNIFMKLHK
jgi:hypothetical protein